MYRRLLANLRSLADNPRIRGEVGWVIGHKTAEFAVAFATLKCFTNLMPREVYGEFNIALTTLLFLTNLIYVPITQAYYRCYHAAEQNEAGRATLAKSMKRLAWATAIVAACCLPLTYPASRIFGLERLTVLMIGVVFFWNHWRSFAVELLDIQRERRLCTLQNVGFFATQCALISLALLLLPRTASLALAFYALAAAIFAYIGSAPLLRRARGAEQVATDPLRGMVGRFGIPLGALLTCQWMQSFGERYILGIQLDLETVGRYVAAYQVCGVPFMLAYAIMNTLVVPIAYQRARDVTDAVQVWSADKILLGGVGIYLIFGAVMTLGYYVFGQPLLRLLTSSDYMLDRGVLFFIALSRYVVFLGLLLHAFFKVHQRMSVLLTISAIGAVLIVPLSWFAVKWYGILGAAGGVLITGLIYCALMIFAPGGCLTLLRSVRRGLHAPRHATPSPSYFPERDE